MPNKPVSWDTSMSKDAARPSSTDGRKRRRKSRPAIKPSGMKNTTLKAN